MSVIDRWRAWYDAFEQCARDDEWDRLGQFLAADAQYRVTGLPFAVVVRGREAIIDGFRRSFAGFDSKFDRRTHQVVGTRVFEPDHVVARVWGGYEKAGLPTLGFPATGHWHFDGEQIGLMVDVYDPAELEHAAAFEWLATHAEAMGGLDPSYA